MSGRRAAERKALDARVNSQAATDEQQRREAAARKDREQRQAAAQKNEAEYRKKLDQERLAELERRMAAEKELKRRQEEQMKAVENQTTTRPSGFKPPTQ